MTKAEFKRLARTHFDPGLVPHGFSTEGSKHSFYWRKISDDIYHFIFASPLRRLDRFDINVFASSSFIHPDFWDRFPDELPFPNGGQGYLSENGVGDYQKLYFCRNEEAFLISFNRDVRVQLIDYALPYLDRIKTLEELIPTIRAKGMIGPALYHIGRVDEARPYIEKEIIRLSKAPSDEYGQIEKSLSFYRGLLNDDVA